MLNSGEKKIAHCAKKKILTRVDRKKISERKKNPAS
jgi:hypothetical protein